MRNIFAAAVGGAIALAGFAGSANASATVDLIWAQTGTSTISLVDVSEAITLRVILRAGPNGSFGGGLSVDYSDAVDKTAVVAFSNSATAPLNTTFGAPINTGTRIENINGTSLSTPLAAGASHQLGTVTFHKDTLGNGTFLFVPDVNGSTDALLDGNFSVIPPSSITFRSASLINAPEPGAISLLAIALGALTLAGRGRRS